MAEILPGWHAKTEPYFCPSDGSWNALATKGNFTVHRTGDSPANAHLNLIKRLKEIDDETTA